MYYFVAFLDVAWVCFVWGGDGNTPPADVPSDGSDDMVVIMLALNILSDIS
jgi:hypothetical protein